MTFQDYDDFVDKKWFIGKSDLGSLPEEAYLGLCIAGECGEVAEKMKKAYRDNSGVLDKEAMIKELGDIFFYLTRYAHKLGCGMEDVVATNMVKLNSREAKGTMRGSGDNR